MKDDLAANDGKEGNAVDGKDEAADEKETDEKAKPSDVDGPTK